MADLPGANFVERIVDHFCDLPVLEARLVQLRSGDPRGQSVRVVAQDVILVRAYTEARLSAEILLDPDFVALTVPLRWTGDYVCNGILAAPDDIFLSSGNDAYTTVGQSRDVIGVGLRRSRLVRECEALLGNAPADAILRDGRVAPGSRARQALRRKLITAMRSALGAPLDLRTYRLSDAVADGLIADTASFLVAHSRSPCDRNSKRITARRVLHAVKETIAEDDAGRISLADLCETAGVGQTWLNRCFRDVWGATPMEYVRARRLSTARDRLLDPEAPAASVKDVSLSLGIMNGGRFAADYEALFGERPSETLARRKMTKRGC